MKFGEILYIYNTFILFCLIDLYYTFYTKSINFEQLFIYEMSILLF